MAVFGAGGDHGVIRLRAVQLAHRQFRAGHVGLQYHNMVMQARHGHLKVDEELGLWVAPVQLQAAGGDVGDVKRLFLCQGATTGEVQDLPPLSVHALVNKETPNHTWVLFCDH